jgi:hypothetical protein
MSRACQPSDGNLAPMSSNCEAGFESTWAPRVITTPVSYSSASTPDYEIPEDAVDMADPRPEVDSMLRSSSNFLEADMMYTMAEPHHSTSIDSDEGTSYSWEPRLWSF